MDEEFLNAVRERAKKDISDLLLEVERLRGAYVKAERLLIELSKHLDPAWVKAPDGELVLEQVRELLAVDIGK